VAGPHAEAYIAMRRLIGLEHAREEVGADRGRSADQQLADLAAAKFLHRLASLDDLREHTLCVGEQGSTGVGQGHPPRAANEEIDPELALEALEPRRQRGLGQVQDFGSPAHVAEPRGLRECLQLR